MIGASHGLMSRKIQWPSKSLILRHYRVQPYSPLELMVIGLQVKVPNVETTPLETLPIVRLGEINDQQEKGTSYNWLSYSLT